MDEKEQKRLLKDGAGALGIVLSEAEINAFIRYLSELKAWNKKINLTSIEGDREIIIRHFLDSLTPKVLLKGTERLLDAGAGAGFPGIPLKIVMPALDIVLLDSVEKKVHFMRHMIRTLGLKGIEAVSGRMEEPSIIKKYGPFDAVISRAFTELKNFIPLSLPYLKEGGRIIAIKGPAYKEELREADTSNLKGPEVFEIPVPFEKRINYMVVFTKE